MAECKGIKFDSDKLRYDLVPWEAMDDVVAVLNHGARKYSPDNWKIVPEAKARYVAAGLRHMVARAKGEILDPESGLPHTAHAVCCLLFLLWFDKRPKEK